MRSKPYTRSTRSKKCPKCREREETADNRDIHSNQKWFFFPMQLIYTGKTLRCLPKGITFPDGFDVTFTSNHWSNEEKAIQHIGKIVLPYLKQTREEFNLPPDQKALLIFDVFKGQTTQRYQEYIHNNHMVLVNVPANMTRYFQPFDLTINGQSKQFLLKKKFKEWYSKQVTSQLAQGLMYTTLKSSLFLVFSSLFMQDGLLAFMIIFRTTAPIRSKRVFASQESMTFC